MNIEKLQKFVNSDACALSDGIKQRIMDNKMTMRDISFMERSIMSMQLLRIKHDLELLVPTFQEGCMRIQEQKNEGDTEVSIDYTLNLLNDTTNLFVDLQEQIEDFGLADVVAVDGYEFPLREGENNEL